MLDLAFCLTLKPNVRGRPLKQSRLWPPQPPLYLPLIRVARKGENHTHPDFVIRILGFIRHSCLGIRHSLPD